MSARREGVALTDICRQLIDEWQFTPEQIESIALNIPGECAAMREQSEQALAINGEAA